MNPLDISEEDMEAYREAEYADYPEDEWEDAGWEE